MASYRMTRGSISDAVVDHGRGMGAPTAVVFVPSHANVVDNMSVPVSHLCSPPRPLPHSPYPGVLTDPWLHWLGLTLPIAPDSIVRTVTKAGVVVTEAGSTVLIMPCSARRG